MMANIILFLSVFTSFLVTLLMVPYWIRKAEQIGLLWEDLNKTSKEKVAGSGGLIVIVGFVIGVLFYVAYRVFYLNLANGFLVEIFALLTVILILSGIGLIDDLFGWRKGGLSKRSRLILVTLSAIPLMAINVGQGEITLPFIGNIALGIIYPLILVPIGIAGATTTFNFLAGYNGLEAGQGVILLSSLAIVAYFTGNSWLAVVALSMILALLAFLVYNFYPAKVFPGDSLTYSVGGLIAIMAILGNFERIAVFFFIPYILETILKSRGKLEKYSFGKVKKDGSLDLKYKKIYSLNHLAILLLKKSGIKATEKRVVYSIWIFQLIIVLLGFVIFSGGIFI